MDHHNHESMIFQWSNTNVQCRFVKKRRRQLRAVCYSEPSEISKPSLATQFHVLTFYKRTLVLTAH